MNPMLPNISSVHGTSPGNDRVITTDNWFDFPEFKSMPRYLFLALCISIALLVGCTAYAQDNTPEVDKIFNWITPASPGCVCAVSYKGKTVLNRAYGSADLERGVPLTTESVFDAASLTKQFVAAAVLILVEEKRLSLSDDVRKHIPELPDYGHKITVDHLLTHTSGLRDWTGVIMLTAGTADALTLTLRQRELNFAPGEEWSYSNSGYVLLKEIVARTSGMLFSEFARKRLFEPLGMNRTVYQNDLREVIKNRALAYSKEGELWKLDMKLDNDRGGGGALLSTASDLLIWNEALTSGRLGNFVTETLQQPATLNNGRKLAYARGLFLDNNRGGKVIWHSGGSASYGSILTRFPEQGLSLAILCNSGESGNKTAFSRRIFDLFFPVTEPKMASDKTPVAPANSVGTTVNLKGRAGLFFSESTREPLQLAVSDSTLRIVGGPALLSIASDRFRNVDGSLSFRSGDKFELQFLSNDQIQLKSMEGVTSRYQRAKSYMPTAEHLQAFVGRYESEEIGTVFHFEVEKGLLVVRLEYSPARKLELKPVDQDTFQAGRMTIRFERDATGKIVALHYSNPVLRNVKFTRMCDRAVSITDTRLPGTNN